MKDDLALGVRGVELFDKLLDGIMARLIEADLKIRRSPAPAPPMPPVSNGQ